MQSETPNTFGGDKDEDVTDWGEVNMEETRRSYSFDPACYSLAEHFLGRDASEDRKRDLAQDFQNAVEMFDHMGIDLANEEPITDKGKRYAETELCQYGHCVLNGPDVEGGDCVCEGKPHRRARGTADG